MWQLIFPFTSLDRLSLSVPSSLRVDCASTWPDVLQAYFLRVFPSSIFAVFLIYCTCLNLLLLFNATFMSTNSSPFTFPYVWRAHLNPLFDLLLTIFYITSQYSFVPLLLLTSLSFYSIVFVCLLPPSDVIIFHKRCLFTVSVTIACQLLKIKGKTDKRRKSGKCTSINCWNLGKAI